MENVQKIREDLRFSKYRFLERRQKFLPTRTFYSKFGEGRISTIILTLTRPIGLAPPAPVAQKIAEQCTLIASLVK